MYVGVFGQKGYVGFDCFLWITLSNAMYAVCLIFQWKEMRGANKSDILF